MDELFAGLLAVRDSPVGLSELGKLLGRTVSRAGLARHLRELLLHAPDEMYSMYRHQLGFEKIVLRNFGGLYPRRLRLHIWRANTDSAIVEDIHNHAYPFASMVLVGCLQDTRYETSDKPHRYKEFVYSANDGACHPSDLEPSTVRYSASTRREVVAGEVYYMQTNEMHSTCSNGSLTVSLQLQDSPVLASVKVARRFGSTQVVASHAYLLPEHVRRDIIGGVVKVLMDE